MKRLRSNNAFTTLEAILVSVILIPVGVAIAKWNIDMSKIPSKLTQSVQMRTVNQVADLLVRDLREAEPSRFPWDQVHPRGSDPTTLSFSVARANPVDIGNPIRHTVRYRFLPDTTYPPGILVRDVDGADEEILLRFTPIPTTARPFVEQDPAAAQVVMIRLRQEAPGQQKYWTIRRITIRG